VICVGNTPGDFIAPEDQGRRILNVICFDHRDAWDIDSRPISGLTVIWDANEQKVLRVIDTGIVPVPSAPFDYDSASISPLREISTPISIEQPLGPSFRLNGHEVIWQKWNFHFRMDRRVGLVLSNVRYADGDKLRSILYEASLSEMFAPYMDPTPDWYYISYFDAGELDDGFPSSLQPGAVARKTLSSSTNPTLRNAEYRNSVHDQFVSSNAPRVTRPGGMRTTVTRSRAAPAAISYCEPFVRVARMTSFSTGFSCRTAPSRSPSAQPALMKSRP
jgi:Cu2+-containing amine oxidase